MRAVNTKQITQRYSSDYCTSATKYLFVQLIGDAGCDFLSFSNLTLVNVKQELIRSEIPGCVLSTLRHTFLMHLECI
jgi:hypothetical protein